jgi:hypothetical protein
MERNLMQTGQNPEKHSSVQCWRDTSSSDMLRADFLMP